MSPSQVFVLSVILSENRHLLFKDHALAFFKRSAKANVSVPHLALRPAARKPGRLKPVGEDQRRAIMSPLPCP